MVSFCYQELLEQIMITACDPSYYYKAALHELRIVEKMDLVFGITLNDETINMSNFNINLKTKELFIKIRAHKISQLFEFVRTNSVRRISIIVTTALCRKKLFSHNDFPALNFFLRCKMPDPQIGYYCYPQPFVRVPVVPFGLPNQ